MVTKSKQNIEKSYTIKLIRFIGYKIIKCNYYRIGSTIFSSIFFEHLKII